MDFDILHTSLVSNFNFESKIDYGLQLVGGGFNIKTLGVVLCTRGKWSKLLIQFNFICFNVIHGKHFLHAFDLLDICFVAVLNILACVSFDHLWKFNCIC